MGQRLSVGDHRQRQDAIVQLFFYSLPLLHYMFPKIVHLNSNPSYSKIYFKTHLKCPFIKKLTFNFKKRIETDSDRITNIFKKRKWFDVVSGLKSILTQFIGCSR